MAQADRNTIKSWFKRGLKPLESQFAALLDSFWHKDDQIPIQNISNISQFMDGLFQNLPVKKSHAIAKGTLGGGKLFRYAEDNTDGVVSPNNSIIGITSNT